MGKLFAFENVILKLLQSDSSVQGDKIQLFPRPMEQENSESVIFCFPKRSGVVRGKVRGQNSFADAQDDTRNTLSKGEGRVGARPFFTLSRISNFRKAQIEILPSHKDRGQEKIPSTFWRYQFEPQNAVMRVRLYASAKPLAGWYDVTCEGLKCSNQHPSQPSLIREGASYQSEGAAHAAMLPTKMKFAFTLAEVLITLGVIGVVAAMTIPNLIQRNFERRVVSQLRETQSILTQAIRMAEEEYGTVEGWMNYSGLWSQEEQTVIANNLKPFLKIAVDCGFTDKEHCIYNGKYQLLNGEMWSDYVSTRHYAIKLLNGSSVWFRSATSSEISSDVYLVFFIDINGQSKPNTVGKDMFTFEYRNSGLFPGSGTANQSCTINDSGWGCAYYVLQNQNMNYLHKK